MNKLFFVLLTFLYSCTKVIDIDVRESESRYVIEAVVTDEPGVCTVRISRSKNFQESNDFSRESGATVMVTDNGQEFLLSETSPGEYTTTFIQGTPGHVYTLAVHLDGHAFTATSTMPSRVVMDSLYVSPGPFGQFKFATITYTDPRTINNGYRFIQYVNGVKEPAIFWEDDDLTDGQTITRQLDVSADEKEDPRNIKSGDEVTVEMQTVDENILGFWYSMRAEGGAGDGITAAPSNPLSNIQGGALGYFSAHTVDRKTVVSP
jgi:hypothetical protein